MHFKKFSVFSWSIEISDVYFNCFAFLTCWFLVTEIISFSRLKSLSVDCAC